MKPGVAGKAGRARKAQIGERSVVLKFLPFLPILPFLPALVVPTHPAYAFRSAAGVTAAGTRRSVLSHTKLSLLYTASS